MKKISALCAVFALWLNFMAAYAACPTGYACLLRDIKNQDSIIRNVQQQKIDEFYKPKLMEPKNKDLEVEIPSYKELLPFSPRYYLMEEK